MNNFTNTKVHLRTCSHYLLETTIFNSCTLISQIYIYILTGFFQDSDFIFVLQTGFVSGFLPFGSGLESDSKKRESEHLWCVWHNGHKILQHKRRWQPTRNLSKAAWVKCH